jgi:peptide chain release factor 1
MVEIYLPDRLKLLYHTFEKLTDPNTVIDSDEWQKIGTYPALLAEIVYISEKRQRAIAELAEVREIFLQSAGDLELREVAAIENEELEAKIAQLTEQLNILLIPRDPDDGQNVFLEVVAVGGGEAGIWVGRILQMYARYAESQHWTIILVRESLDERGHLIEALLEIQGDSVYSKLKFETGIHQLSTTTNNLVAARIKVIPQPDPKSIDIQPTEIEVYTRNSIP